MQSAQRKQLVSLFAQGQVTLDDAVREIGGEFTEPRRRIMVGRRMGELVKAGLIQRVKNGVFALREGGGQ